MVTSVGLAASSEMGTGEVSPEQAVISACTVIVPVSSRQDAMKHRPQWFGANCIGELLIKANTFRSGDRRILDVPTFCAPSVESPGRIRIECQEAETITLHHTAPRSGLGTDPVPILDLLDLSAVGSQWPADWLECPIESGPHRGGESPA